MVAALALGIVQSGVVFAFPTGGELVYRESWRVSESDGTTSLSSTAERVMRLRVKETTKGRTRFEVTFHGLAVRSEDKGLADDFRSWIEQPNRDQWVTDRGYVERKGDSVRGNRPFLGLVLPPPGKSIPDRWSAKLLPPIGSERPTDFEFRISAGQSDLPITVAAKDKFGSTQLTLTGRVNLSLDGTVSTGDLTTTIVDSDTKTTTVIEYRFQRQ